MRPSARRLGDRVVRRARQQELAPVRVRVHRRRRFAPPASTSALLTLTLGFAGLIAAGTVLLMLPPASVDPGRADWLTALFTATSATCVTGLVVVDTATYWSGFGQGVIIALMFLGGLGIMSAGVVVLTAIGRRISLNQRLLVRETMGSSSLGSVVQLGRNILWFALAVQAVGTLVLFLRFAIQYPLGQAAWDALFHTVSAFNNAGFTIFKGSASLEGYQTDPWTLGIIGLLIVLGGISFPVVAELARRRRPSRWTLDTRLVITGTLALWGAGAVTMLLFELHNPATLGTLGWVDRIGNATFQAVTARTAGFSSIDFSATRPGNDFLFMVLMFIGGASGSAAGGIKVNTFMVLLVAGLASVRGRERAEFAGREIPYPQVARALAILLLSIVVLSIVVVTLAITELDGVEQGRFGFLSVLFEAVSALGTTGLSRGVTPYLSDAGKITITVAMYLGRLGPLTVALGLALRERRAVYRYAQERVRIG
ncbi:MAG: potassium transporter TrkG [Chloroflexota bacterium]